MPGITNPAEEYFKDGSWGWDGSVWRKLPLVWGYSDRYAETVSNLSAGAGINSLLGSQVADGEIWVVQSVCATNATNAPTQVWIEVYDNATEGILVDDTTPAAGVQTLWTGSIVMKKDDRVRAYFTGCIANDDLFLRIWGYKMKIAE